MAVIIMSKTIPLTEFDMLTQPDYIQLIKAILPFMEYNMQKNISMLIRAYELKNTIFFYNSPANCNIFKTCSNSSGISFNTPISEILGNEKLINTIATYCPGNIVNMINTYKKFSQMSDMFNMMDMFNDTHLNKSDIHADIEHANNADSCENIVNNNNPHSNFPDSNIPDSKDIKNNSNNMNNTQNNSMNYNLLNNIMNQGQKDMYNEYIKQLDALDLKFNEHN